MAHAILSLWARSFLHRPYSIPGPDIVNSKNQPNPDRPSAGPNPASAPFPRAGWLKQRIRLPSHGLRPSGTSRSPGRFFLPFLSFLPHKSDEKWIRRLVFLVAARVLSGPDTGRVCVRDGMGGDWCEQDLIAKLTARSGRAILAVLPGGAREVRASSGVE